MLDDEDRNSQLERLKIHRGNVEIFLDQQALLGGKGWATPAVINGITEARENIQRIKEYLRSNGVEVKDGLNDTPHLSEPDRLRLQVLRALASLEEPAKPKTKFPPSMVAATLGFADVQRVSDCMEDLAKDGLLDCIQPEGGQWFVMGINAHGRNYLRAQTAEPATDQ